MILKLILYAIIFSVVGAMWFFNLDPFNIIATVIPLSILRNELK